MGPRRAGTLLTWVVALGVAAGSVAALGVPQAVRHQRLEAQRGAVAAPRVVVLLEGRWTVCLRDGTQRSGITSVGQRVVIVEGAKRGRWQVPTEQVVSLSRQTGAPVKCTDR